MLREIWNMLRKIEKVTNDENIKKIEQKVLDQFYKNKKNNM